MSVAVSSAIGTISGLVVAGGILVGGLWWIAQRLIKAGAWFSSITANTEEIKALRIDLNEFRKEARAWMEENSRRISQIEHHRPPS